MNLAGKLLLIIFYLFLITRGFCATRVDTTAVKISVKKDSTRQVDIIDKLHSWLHAGFSSPSKGDSVGLKPTFSVVPAIGYELQSRMAILVSGNMAFRTGEQSRVSVVNFSTSYNQNAQFTLPLLWDIWSKTNGWNFTGEMRFYSYPQSTYGLGSDSFVRDQNPMDYNYIRVSETALRRIAGNFYIGGGYILDDHWGISDQKGVSSTIPDFGDYNPGTHTVSSALTFDGFYDTRDCAINPTNGFYAMYQYRQNMMALGSTSNWNSLILDVRKYFRFPANSNNVLAFWSYDWVTLSGKPPYLDLPATLWDNNTNTGRGYIQGRFRGAQMVYTETEYRYRITSDGLLGGVFFVNAQSFSAAPGTHLQAVQPGYGPGLRVKLNKVSKTNICVDYGFGTQGSKGLFVNVGELF